MVRTSNNLEQWIKFFLVGIAATAQKGKQTFEGIIALRHSCESQIVTLGRRTKIGQELLKLLYSEPITNSKSVSRKLNLTHPTVNRLIADFQRMGILREMTGFKKNRLFAFHEYLALFLK